MKVLSVDENTGKNSAMPLEKGVSLKPYNSFGLPAIAHQLVRICNEHDVRRVLDDPRMGLKSKLILGGGSNMVLTRDLTEVVLKVEIMGRQVTDVGDAWIVEVGAGENWHQIVTWTLEQGMPGLENMALIPGTMGASPVQNIGAYGVELKDRLDSVEVVSLITGRQMRMDAADCELDYRNSIFKHALAGKCIITRVRLRLPKVWKPILGYLDLERKMTQEGVSHPSPRQVYDWICSIRRHKLPDPVQMGNAGSFFKNPVVTPDQCRDIIARDPEIVHYPMADGSFKLAAGWMIDACGWKGKNIGCAGVYEKQALVLVNRGEAIGAEVVTLARAIQESVYGRFGIRLEPEPLMI